MGGVVDDVEYAKVLVRRLGVGCDTKLRFRVARKSEGCGDVDISTPS